MDVKKTARRALDRKLHGFVIHAHGGAQIKDGVFDDLGQAPVMAVAIEISEANPLCGDDDIVRKIAAAIDYD